MTITTEAEAIAAGMTRRVQLDGQGASFEALISPDADLDGAFEAFAIEEPEMLVVSGWLIDSIEDVEPAKATCCYFDIDGRPVAGTAAATPREALDALTALTNEMAKTDSRCARALYVRAKLVNIA